MSVEGSAADFGEPDAGGLPPMPPELLTKPPAREPAWVLALGIVLFLTLLGLAWQESATQNSAQPDSTAMALDAREQTYKVTYYLSQQLTGNTAGQSSITKQLTTTALDGAKDWRNIAELKGPTEYRARVLLNAAALDGVAARYNFSRQAISRAMRINPSEADTYRQLAPLYGQPPKVVPFTPRVTQLLTRISSGPLFYARNALLTRHTAAAVSALKPGAQAGERCLAVDGGFGVFILALILAAIAIVLVRLVREGTRRQANLTVRAEEPTLAPPTWGIGTALILISVIFFVTSLLVSLIVTLLGTNSANTELFLPVNAAVEVLVTVVVLGLFLLTQHKNPIDWTTFGWRRGGGGVGYGLLTLIAVYPLIILATVVTQLLFHNAQGSPLVSVVQTTNNPLLVIIFVVTVVMMAPLIEETLFRGLLFRAMNARMPFWGAAVISGVLFSLGHTSLGELLPIAVLGTAFAYMTRRTGGLWASAAAHAAFNGFTTLSVLLLRWALSGPGG
jgi:membrane protease YdiL (CAAX protease family)